MYSTLIRADTTERLISNYRQVTTMSGVTRRDMLKGAAAAGTSVIGATAGCLEGDGDVPVCSTAVDAEPVADDAVEEDVDFVLYQIESNTASWVDQMNDRLVDRDWYDGDIFDDDSVALDVYEGGSLVPDGYASRNRPSQYDVMISMETDSDGAFRDIAAFMEEEPMEEEPMEEEPREVEVGLTYGLETMVSSAIKIPVVRQTEQAVEDPTRYAAFQDSTGGLRARIVDERGSYGEVYVPEHRVESYADDFSTRDEQEVYDDITDYVERNMDIQLCE